MKWRLIKTAPKGPRILLLHAGYQKRRVGIGQWVDQVVPDWLYNNAIHSKTAHTLPGKNPHCRARWVSEALEPLGHGGYLYNDLLVIKPYAWDPIKPTHWMPLPKPPGRRKKSG